MTTQSKEPRRKSRSTVGRVEGIRFDWDSHGCDGYAVPVQDRNHEDSGDLIAAKIRRDWSEENESVVSEGADPHDGSEGSPDDPDSENG